MIRSLVLMLTILAIIFLADNWPKPVKVVQTDYCVVRFRGAAKNPLDGRMNFFWTSGYRPCSEQDEFYENMRPDTPRLKLMRLAERAWCLS